MAVKRKYQPKIDAEIEKKHKALYKKEEAELHNLKVEYSDDKRLKMKPLVKAPTLTAEKKKTAHIFNRMCKLHLWRISNDQSSYEWECYTCGEYLWICKTEDWMIRRNRQAQAGHMIKKDSNNWLLLYSPVIRLQCEACNCRTAHDQKDRENKWRKDVGEDEYNNAIQAKEKITTFTIPQLKKKRTQMINIIWKFLTKIS